MKISKKEKNHFHYSSRGCCGENFRSVSFLVWSGRKSEHEDPQKMTHTTENRNHPAMFCIHICLVPLKIGIILGRWLIYIYITESTKSMLRPRNTCIMMYSVFNQCLVGLIHSIPGPSQGQHCKAYIPMSSLVACDSIWNHIITIVNARGLPLIGSLKYH